jgi:hypothetical protein
VQPWSQAAEIIVKFFLAPAVILLVAFAASQHPDETIALVASAINQAREHPTVTSGRLALTPGVVLLPGGGKCLVIYMDHIILAAVIN